MPVPQFQLGRRRAIALCNSFIAAIADRYFSNIAIQLCILAVTIISCVWYISGTYSDEGQSVSLEIFIFSVFCFDYIMCITAAQRKVDYICSPIGFADLISMVPIIAIYYPLDPVDAIPWPPSWLGFCRFFRVLNMFQLIRSRNAFSAKTHQNEEASIILDLSEVSYQIGKLFINILVFILVSTGIVYSVSSFEDEAFRHPFVGRLTWFDTFYFTVVTATTVGEIQFDAS